MKIYYISLGSFCYPKIIIRETGREYVESLPFDFNSSPNLSGIINILKHLYENGSYEIELNDIIAQYNGDELAVSEKNNMYLVHFFKERDLNCKIDKFPVSANYLKEDVVFNIKNLFNKRFKRLYDILNDTQNIICFMRIENFENRYWRDEMMEFTRVLSLFKNPNKFLIYSQILIDEHLHYNNSNVLNYDYKIPIFFWKYYFYDKEIIDNRSIFINVLESFEQLLNSDNILNINNKGIIEKYYINKTTLTIYKLTNINYFSKYYIDFGDCDTLYINNVISGYDKYIKNGNQYESD